MIVFGPSRIVKSSAKKIYRLLGNRRAQGREAMTRNESIASNYTQIVVCPFFFLDKQHGIGNTPRRLCLALQVSGCSFDSTVINVAPIY